MLPRQNVWRVYADVFSNLMGLVLLGGMGMMALFGGAALATFPSATVFPSACPTAKDAQAAVAATGFASALSDTGCEVTVSSTGINFANGETAVSADATLDRMCRLVAAALRLTEPDGGRVQIVGHASAVSRGGRCEEVGLHSAGEYDRHKRQHQADRFAAEMADVLKRTATSPERVDVMRSVSCNYQVAADRAVAVGKECISRLYHGDYDAIIGTMTAEAATSRLDVVTDSSLDVLSQRQLDCANRNPSDPDSCARTVTVRIIAGAHAP